MGSSDRSRQLINSSEGANRQAASGDNLCATNSCPSTIPIYLTFDDGPNSGTSSVLEVLRRASVKATFFLNYEQEGFTNPAKYSLVKRIINEGHALGNHGLDHDPYRESQYRDEANLTAVRQDFIDNITKFTELFKSNHDHFPGFSCARLAGAGKDFPNYVSMINSLGMIHVSWDNEFAPMDIKLGHLRVPNWQGVNGVKSEFPNLPKNEDIMLLHDMHWAGKGSLLLRLINKFKQTSTIAPTLPLHSSHRRISR